MKYVQTFGGASTITQEGIQCPRCKDVIFSNSRHDFVSCSCEACFIDGGFDYNRQGYDPAVGMGIPVTRTVKPPLSYYYRDEVPASEWDNDQEIH